MRYYGIVVSSWSDPFMLRATVRDYDSGHRTSVMHMLFASEERARKFWADFIADKFQHYALELEWNLEYNASSNPVRLVATKRRQTGLEVKEWNFTVLPVPEDMSDSLKIEQPVHDS